MTQNFEDLSNLLEVKFIFAFSGMLLIMAGMIAIIYVIVVSFKKRKEAIAVNLPDISGDGVVSVEPAFNEIENLNVELISEDEDVVKNSKIEDNEDQFLTALSCETKTVFLKDGVGNLEMPEIGEIDYEKIKKDKENSNINHLRELAEDDKDFDQQKI